jgi:hypothetical protein
MATNLTKAFVDLIAPNFQNLYVALIRQDGSECSGGGYLRQTFGLIQTYEDTNYIYISNASQIIFALATSDIAPLNNLVSQVQLYNGSNLVATIDLTQAKPYLNQDQFIIAIDGLKIKIPKVNT